MIRLRMVPTSNAVLMEVALCFAENAKLKNEFGLNISGSQIIAAIESNQDRPPSQKISINYRLLLNNYWLNSIIKLYSLVEVAVNPVANEYESVTETELSGY